MILGIIAIACSVLLFIATERCKRNPEVCKNGFMHESGYTRSLVALWYFIGKPREAREAITHDEDLRKKFVIESYIWSLIGLVAGFTLIFVSR